jgi:serine/threonine protein kinase
MITSNSTETELDNLLKPCLVSIDEYDINDSVTLGNGTNGEVCLATRNNNEYAFKQIHASLSHDILKIKRNLLLYSKLEHNNLVKMVSYDFIKGLGKNKTFAIIMEKAQANLASSIIENPTLFKDINSVKLFMSQMFSVFSYFTLNSVVHRDVKPQNILLHQISPTIWKLADMSFAKDDSSSVDSSVSHSSAFLGTVAYMAPEIKRNFMRPGEKMNWRKCDIFSLGMVFLYICGMHKDEGLNEGTDQEILIKLSKSMNRLKEKYDDQKIIEVIGMMLLPNPENRPDFGTLHLSMSSQEIISMQGNQNFDAKNLVEKVRELEILLDSKNTKLRELEILLSSKDQIILEKDMTINQLQKQIKELIDESIIRKEKKNEDLETKIEREKNRVLTNSQEYNMTLKPQNITLPVNLYVEDLNKKKTDNVVIEYALITSPEQKIQMKPERIVDSKIIPNISTKAINDLNQVSNYITYLKSVMKNGEKIATTIPSFDVNQITNLHLSQLELGCTLDDAKMNQLSKSLSALKLTQLHLNFERNQITDNGMNQLSKSLIDLKQLTQLHLNFNNNIYGGNNQITDNGMNQLSKSLIDLKQLTQLHLYFSGGKVSKTAKASILEHFPRATISI